MIVPSSVFGKTAPSERVTFALIGCGNKGFHWLEREVLNQPNAHVLAVCDVNRGSDTYANRPTFMGREPAQEMVNQRYAKKFGKGRYRGCDAHVDFREVLKRDDIDAVGIVLPDHWHAPVAVLAAQAKKAIYCEKPMTLTVAEGREMIDAVRNNDVVFQCGTQERHRSDPRRLAALARTGALGEIKRVITLVGPHNVTGPGPGWKPMPVPERFDYARWLGPAPEADYHVKRCLYAFRFIYDYSGGQVTNLGMHCNDIAQWGLAMDGSGPVEVEAISAKFLPEGSLFNAALETNYRCRYANGVVLESRFHSCGFGVRFEGTEGSAQVGFNQSPHADPGDLWGRPVDLELGGMNGCPTHFADFINSAKAHKDPLCPVETGHSSTTLCHLGNIAVWMREKVKSLKWDPEKEVFTNSDEANLLLSRQRRAPWDDLSKVM